MYLLAFDVSPLVDAKIPFSGPYIKAFFTSLLRKINDDLTEKVQNVEGIKPYSIAPLSLDNCFSFHLARKSLIYNFRISLLNEEVFSRLITPILNALPDTVDIDGKKWLIRRVSLDKIAFERLYEINSIDSSFRLNFLTPTYPWKCYAEFHGFLPAPINIFYNLIETWNAFSPIKFNSESFREWVDKSMVISSSQLKIWKHVDISDAEEPTVFTGWCNYKITESEDYSMKEHERWCKLIYALGRFAEIANVGENRTAGFGVVKFAPSLVNSLQKTSTC